MMIVNEMNESDDPASSTGSDDLRGGDDAEKAFSSDRSKPHTMREAYGFVAYLSTIIIAIFWNLWVFAPDEYLDRLGITYRPRK